MIKIDLNETKKDFRIKDKTFTANFSDDTLRHYFEIGKEIDKLDKDFEEKFPDIENERDFGKVAQAVIEALPVRAESYQEFFDETFGEGSGAEIYEICGESTPNMKKVFDAVWNEILKHMAGIETKEETTAKKYIKNKNIQRR